MSLEIRTVQKGSMALLEVCGEVDLHTSPQFRAEVLRVAADKRSTLLVNLEEVNYIDSSGVAILIEALKCNKRNGGRMVLFGLKKEVNEILKLARMDKLFTVRPDFDTAIKWLANSVE